MYGAARAHDSHNSSSQQGSVLTLFDNEELWPHRHDLLSTFYQAVLTRHLARFFIIDGQPGSGDTGMERFMALVFGAWYTSLSMTMVLAFLNK